MVHHQKALIQSSQNQGTLRLWYHPEVGLLHSNVRTTLSLKFISKLFSRLYSASFYLGCTKFTRTPTEFEKNLKLKSQWCGEKAWGEIHFGQNDNIGLLDSNFSTLHYIQSMSSTQFINIGVYVVVKFVAEEKCANLARI